ncbi:MAG: hypothetical protein AAGJ54_03885 [Planctomycetota bacterium]
MTTQSQLDSAVRAMPESGREIGPYVLAHRMPDADVPRPASDGSYRIERWIALHTPDESDRIVHVFSEPLDDAELDRAQRALWKLASNPHRHLLCPERIGIDHRTGELWAASRFVGHNEHLLTLAEHRERKGGFLPPHEAERAVIQLLQALECAHNAGILSGPQVAEEVLVDQRGSVCLELHGIARALDGLEVTSKELVVDEVRSVVEIGFCLLTGMTPGEAEGVRPSRLVKRLDRAWDRWFETGLDPVSCFETASDAIAALPSSAFDAQPKPGVIGTIKKVFDGRAWATAERSEAEPGETRDG